jgi:hypothetical protein
VNKVIITGSNGFIGRHLINFLRLKGVDVYCISRTPLFNVKYFLFETINSEAIKNIIGKIAPDHIFHLAGTTNPDPEISYENAKKTKIAVFGTGRSDYPNQINNVLAFPGLFRGVLDAGIKQITDEIKINVDYPWRNFEYSLAKSQLSIEEYYFSIDEVRPRGMRWIYAKKK